MELQVRESVLLSTCQVGSSWSTWLSPCCCGLSWGQRKRERKGTFSIFPGMTKMTKITSSEQTSDTVAHNDLPCCSAVVKDIQKKKKPSIICTYILKRSTNSVLRTKQCNAFSAACVHQSFPPPFFFFNTPLCLVISKVLPSFGEHSNNPTSTLSEEIAFNICRSRMTHQRYTHWRLLSSSRAGYQLTCFAECLSQGVSDGS